MTQSKYRPDIDGLRAVAVLAVLLYHFGVPGLPGGFVGVDVFFVISGYLITGIVAAEIAQGRFSLLAFYERRARRLFPALAVVLIATGIVGAWLLLPTDLLLLARSTLATLAFGSNIFYWRNSGYFDSVSELNPLLHTWSLAVEEQFYLVFPLLLLLLTQRGHRWRLPVLWLLVLLSLAACVAFQTTRPTATFYLAPFRAWELGLGALIALGGLPRVRQGVWLDALATLGLLLIAAGILGLRAGDNFPGWRAVAPVLGTVLILHTGACGSTWVSRLLSMRPMVGVGLISYSLYLWHWPVKVYAQYVGGAESIKDWTALPWMAMSVVLAYLSYRWVEQPARRRQGVWAMSGGRLITGTLVGSVAIGLLAVPVLSSNGWPSRFPAATAELDRMRVQTVAYRACFGLGAAALERDACRLGRPDAPPTVMLLGDSHAASIAPAFDAILRANGLGGVVLPSSSCPPLLGAGNRRESKCLGSNASAFDAVGKNPAVRLVVLHAFWISYTGRDPQNADITKTIYRRHDDGREQDLDFGADLQRTVAHLVGLGKQVLVIGPMVEAPMTPTEIVFATLARRALVMGESLEHFNSRKADRFNQHLADLQAAGAKVWLPTSALCGSGVCDYVRDGRPLFRDRNHLSVEGAQYLGKSLASDLHVLYPGIGARVQ